MKTTITLDTAVRRAFAQSLKAIVRGDFAAADRWTSILERQLFCARRIDALANRAHRRHSQRPLPPKPEPKRFNKWGGEISPIPESMKRQIAEADERLRVSQMKKLGLEPRRPRAESQT